MMFGKQNVKPIEKYIEKLNDSGVASPTDFYIREFSCQPGLKTRILNPSFLSEYWGKFSLVEKRFIEHLYEQYYVWKYYLLVIRKRSKKPVYVTSLQQEVFDNKWSADDFFSYLIEEMTTLDEISKGLDIIKNLKTYQSADAFEASCYFFLIAHHFLSDGSFMLEYQNALSEALEHQGEFKGWAAAMLYKSELYGKFLNKDKELGAFKLCAFDLLEEWYINGDKNKNGDEFKTDVEVQKELNDALKEMRGKIKTGPDDFSATIKNWYDVKDSELKKLIKRLVSR